MGTKEDPTEAEERNWNADDIVVPLNDSWAVPLDLILENREIDLYIILAPLLYILIMKDL